MQQIHERVAGLDVHRDSVVACFRHAWPPGRRSSREGAVHHHDRGPAGARGVAGRPGRAAGRDGGHRRVLEAGALRAGAPVHGVVVQRASTSRRSPDASPTSSDAEWLADVAAHGMVRPSFVPPLPIRELRELTRYRKTQIDARVAEIQRLEKVLQDAGVKLTSVASKVLTQSARSMIEALIAGERDPARARRAGEGQDATEDPGAHRSAGRPLRLPPRRRLPTDPRSPRLPR